MYLIFESAGGVGNFEHILRKFDFIQSWNFLIFLQTFDHEEI